MAIEPVLGADPGRGGGGPEPPGPGPARRRRRGAAGQPAPGDALGRPGCWRCRTTRTSRELHLDGRGLLLVPSFFCAATPVALLDPALPPVLVYPVDRLGGLAPAPGEGAGRPVAAGAAGARRAARAVPGRRCWRRATTAAPPARWPAGCDISPAAASQHATVLRNAGLLVSHRDRNTVLHTLTPLGRAMLDALSPADRFATAETSGRSRGPGRRSTGAAGRGRQQRRRRRPRRPARHAAGAGRRRTGPGRDRRRRAWRWPRRGSGRSRRGRPRRAPWRPSPARTSLVGDQGEDRAGRDHPGHRVDRPAHRGRVGRRRRPGRSAQGGGARRSPAGPRLGGAEREQVLLPASRTSAPARPGRRPGAVRPPRGSRGPPRPAPGRTCP